MHDDLDLGALPNWCVFTEAGVVRRALDAIDWTEAVDLAGSSLLEPAAGNGAFVTEAARRLLASFERHGHKPTWETLGDRILAFEIEVTLADVLRAAVESILGRAGVSGDLSSLVAARWCRKGDFFANELPSNFTHAVGNPPFRRGGGSRPDICVSFVSRSFDHLSPGGRIAMLAPVTLGSATGAARLREAVLSRGTLESIESYEPNRAFVRKVGVRGALFVMRRDMGENRRKPVPTMPWLAGSSDARDAYASAAARMPILEEAGCKVRLGMATGRNSVFVRSPSDFGVERDVLVPAVATRDLGPLEVEWRGLCVLDTARPDGRPWSPQEKPQLYAYLRRYRHELTSRFSVQTGSHWRLTHTRLDRPLAAQAKVLVAETANPCRVALDRGGHMPLNSVHAVTSDVWPLEALHAVLAAVAVGLVANALLLRRAGGYLRVNATALRQVRIPNWNSLRDTDRQGFASGSFEQACETAARVFKIQDKLLRQCVGAPWEREGRGAEVGRLVVGRRSFPTS